jgi:hypothetical protein
MMTAMTERPNPWIRLAGAGALLDQTKSVPPRYMRWRMAASLRATATMPCLSLSPVQLVRRPVFRAPGSSRRLDIRRP